MDGFKEFQGKNLDAAIDEACAYFDTAREKLEIDIVQDSKSGIFGIVGARKAVVRVRRVQLLNRDEVLAPQKTEVPPQKKDSGQAKKSEPAPVCACEKKKENPRKNVEATQLPPVTSSAMTVAEKSAEPTCAPCSEDARPAKAEKTLPAESPTAEGLDLAHGLDDDAAIEGMKTVPFENIDLEELKSVCHEVVSTLVLPIINNAQIDVEVQNDRVLIGITSDEDSGLLIGREGQTLSALQYMSSRLVGRRMECAVRMQFDVDNYRRRQDDHLRHRAEEMAARVRATGKSCSTRPLSSYHRRVIHLTLQNDPEISTRSIGEGALKRVVIQRRRRDARDSKDS